MNLWSSSTLPAWFHFTRATSNSTILNKLDLFYLFIIIMHINHLISDHRLPVPQWKFLKFLIGFIDHPLFLPVADYHFIVLCLKGRYLVIQGTYLHVHFLQLAHEVLLIAVHYLCQRLLLLKLSDAGRLPWSAIIVFFCHWFHHFDWGQRSRELLLYVLLIGSGEIVLGEGGFLQMAVNLSVFAYLLVQVVDYEPVLHYLFLHLPILLTQFCHQRLRFCMRV